MRLESDPTSIVYILVDGPSQRPRTHSRPQLDLNVG